MVATAAFVAVSMVTATALMAMLVVTAAALVTMTVVSTAALMALTVVAAAALMAFSMVPMMIALCVGIIAQTASQKGFHLRIGIPCGTGIKLDTHLCQGIFSTTANAAADKSAHFMPLKKSSQSAMSAAVSIHNLT